MELRPLHWEEVTEYTAPETAVWCSLDLFCELLDKVPETYWPTWARDARDSRNDRVMMTAATFWRLHKLAKIDTRAEVMDALLVKYGKNVDIIEDDEVPVMYWTPAGAHGSAELEGGELKETWHHDHD